MTEALLVVVSEWMENGTINEFVNTDAMADRLNLVRPSFRVPLLLVTDNDITIVARGRHPGVDLYARPEDNPWESQRGMFLNL